MNLWIVALAAGAVLALQHLIVRLFAFRGLEYSRTVSRNTVYAGEKITLTEVIRNDRPLFIPWMLVESRVSSYAVFGKREDLEVSGERYHRSFFTLMPYKQVTRIHQVTMKRRGEYPLGNLRLTCGDLVGLGSAAEEMDQDVFVRVFPAKLNLPIPYLPLTGVQGEITDLRSLMKDPCFFSGVREYRSGDSIRDIHWPATGKTGTLQVKVHDPVGSVNLMVVFNSQLRPDQWGSLTDAEQEKVEYGISLAAEIIAWVLDQGASAGFSCDMTLGSDGDEPMILPEARREQKERILVCMSRLAYRRKKRFATYLNDLLTFRDMDILIISAYEDSELKEKMKELSRRHRSVSLCLVREAAI
ncbi:MAG: DUF58 domain-containing protein [Clostridia bacterium]|nr:DUF58 domain-containing protein [Clostridia bacterium]